MEIKLYSNTRNEYLDCRPLVSSSDGSALSATPEKRQENYDRVTIHTDFSRGMPQKAADVNGDSASPERIISLQRQIATGTYPLDSRRIAECMLIRRSQPGLF